MLANKRSDLSFTFKTCKEIFVTIPVVAYFRKDFFLINDINIVISRLEAAGLIEFWHRKYANEFNPKSDDVTQIMTVGHMVGCFELWAAGCLMSVIFFVIESVYYMIKK